MKHSFLSLTTVLMVALSGVTSFVNAQTVTKMRIWQQGQVQWTAYVQDVDSITFVETSITSIALNKTEVTLAEGSTIKLIASANDGMEGSYSWMSSNEEVATVDTYGIVTAVKKGTATITVTETTTNLTATCKVIIVGSEIETLEFTQATVAFYNRSEYLATLDTVDSIFSFTDNTGERHYLRGFLVDVDVNIYSDGLYINDNGDMDGATVGYIAHFPGKAYYAPAGMNDDRGYEDAVFSSTGIWATAYKENRSHKLFGGYVKDNAEAIEHVKTAFEYYNEGDMTNYSLEMMIADTIAFKNGNLRRYEYVPSYGEYYTTYFPEAVVSVCNMQIDWNENSKYMYSVPAIEMEMTPLGGDYGLGVEIEINEITNEWKLMSNDFIFEPVITYKRITENAPARDKNLFPVLLTQKDLQHKVLTAQPKNVRRTAMPLR